MTAKTQKYSVVLTQKLDNDSNLLLSSWMPIFCSIQGLKVDSSPNQEMACMSYSLIRTGSQVVGGICFHDTVVYNMLNM